jgi:hypothetical protein
MHGREEKHNGVFFIPALVNMHVGSILACMSHVATRAYW